MNPTLPRNEQIEKEVLGLIMRFADGTLPQEALAQLRPEHFSLESNHRIFATIARLGLAGKPTDYVSVHAELKRAGEAQQVGGLEYLLDLHDGSRVPRTSLDHHIGQLKECYRKRQIYLACESTMAKALANGYSSRECADEISEALLQLQAETSEGPTFIGEGADAHLDKLLKARDANVPQGFPTGIQALDEMTGALRKGEVMVLGGRTGEGKTTIADQIAELNASRGTVVMKFALEMSKEQNRQRLWSLKSGLFNSKLRNPERLSDGDVERLRRAHSEVAGLPILVDDTGSLSVSELAARARLAVRRHGVELVIVDYLQLVHASGRDLREKVNAVSAALMALKKELGIAILALSQIPRLQNPNVRPTKNDLKESGNLENDADLVVMLFRPVDEFNQFIDKDELIVAKQREGETGIVPVQFNKKTLRYEERYA